ncbi:hypothetical protein GCM10027203_00740 [Nonomuraea fastidiosa]
MRWYISTGTSPASLARTCRANSGVDTTPGGSPTGVGAGGSALPWTVVAASGLACGLGSPGMRTSPMTATVITATFATTMIRVSDAGNRTKLPAVR